MSRLIQCIQRSLDLLDMALLELVMPEVSRKERDSVINSASISISDTLGMLQKHVQELLEQQQAQDSALAIKLGKF